MKSIFINIIRRIYKGDTPSVVSLPVWALILLLATAGCREDDWREIWGDGKPTVLSMNVKVSEAEKVTRSDMSSDDANRVTSLWLGIYSVATSQATFNKMLTADEGFTAGVKDTHNGYNLQNIRTKAGESYIVAVANPESYTAYSVSDDGTMTEENLKTLLTNADTWREFQSICLKNPGTEVSGTAMTEKPTVAQNSGLPMCGIYVPDNRNPAHCWEDVGPVTIQAGTDNLSGSIHLRRPWSQVKFEIQATGNILSIEPYQWQVHNVPVYTWLNERRQTAQAGVAGTANPGDLVDSRPKDNSVYISSPLYQSASITSENITDGTTTSKVYKFDFWQGENKRTGLDKCTDYQKRELQWLEDGTEATNESTGDGTDINPATGIYTSLCPTASGNVNNNAGYVDIYANVTYKNKTSANDDLGITGGKTRTAKVKYTIHLGYVGENPDPKDFNLLRNSIYTYRVYVQDVNKILVEAFRKGEPQPGAEGVISDVDEEPFMLDCHYQQFNIYLSATEIANFSYDLTTYDNGAEKRFYVHRDAATGNTEEKMPSASEKNDYFDWVKLRYVGTGTGNTSDANAHVFALYHPDNVLTLDQVNSTNCQPGWYTVFINEYAYETAGGNESGSTRWKGYVNQPARSVYFNLVSARSGDNQSVYYRSKYAAIQHSIQTYYNPAETGATALGVEHRNEMYGVNLRWNTTDYSNSSEQGRSILRSYLGTTAYWNTYVSRESQQHINRAQNTSMNFDQDAHYENLPALVLIPNNNLNNVTQNQTGNPAAALMRGRATSYDPQPAQSNDTQYLQIMNACLSRNRDENGNGTIDNDELKWYLPVSGTYLRIIVGRRGLSTPLMSYPASIPRDADHSGMYKAATANSKILWGDQGLAFSNVSGPYCPPPWQVRCVRNLGTDLTQTGSSVTEAYSHKATERYVIPDRYMVSSLRQRTENPIPVNYTNQLESNICQFGFEYQDGQTGTSSNPGNLDNYRGSLTAYNTWIVANSVCSQLNSTTGKTGWRIPNQKELAILYSITKSLGVESDAGKKVLDFSTLGSSYSDQYAFMSCTAAPYPDSSPYTLGSDAISRIFVVNVNNPTIQGLGASTDYYGNLLRGIKCVRDLTNAEYQAAK